MARSRKASESLEFGSDSFLDIVANIVGILIILIVIAGVRMSQTPPEQVELTEAAAVIEEAVVDPIAAEPALPPEPIVDYAALQAQADEAIRQLERYRQEPVTSFEVQLGITNSFVEPADPEIDARIVSAQQQIAQERQRLAQAQNQLNQLEASQSKLKSHQVQVQAQLTKLKNDQLVASQAQQQTMTRVAELMKQKANLAEQLVLVQRDAKPSATIQHAMVPMSKQVAGHEWHFEVRGGKVAFIPLDELMSQLHTKVERWAEWIAKYDTHEGIVGPVEGFSMEYKVSRERKSLAEELANGPGVFRVGLDRWELIPAGQGYAESLEQASHPQSMFRSTLNRCSLDDTITLWVYPDSFEMYQELSKIAHQMGYRVAARPLPMEKRIGGSPHGSKSVSQ